MPYSPYTGGEGGVLVGAGDGGVLVGAGRLRGYSVRGIGRRRPVMRSRLRAGAVRAPARRTRQAPRKAQPLMTAAMSARMRKALGMQEYERKSMPAREVSSLIRRALSIPSVERPRRSLVKRTVRKPRAASGKMSPAMLASVKRALKLSSRGARPSRGSGLTASEKRQLVSQLSSRARQRLDRSKALTYGMGGAYAAGFGGRGPSRASKRAAKRNPWLAHVAMVRNENPMMSYKEALQAASESYHRL